MNKTIGLFFGSFNPIHVGHLIIANHVVQLEHIDEVWLVISPHNPHKIKESLLPDLNRLYMVNLAVEDNNKLRASDIEFKMPQPSYTIDTLTYLKEKYPQNEFCLIMGEDNLRSFHKWKNYESILNAHKLLVYPRVLTEQEIDKEQKLNTIIEPQHFEMIDAPLMKIAASFIRNSIREKKDVRYLLTEPVWKYCDEMSFYR